MLQVGLIASILFLLSVMPAFGHGLGETIEKEVGDYIVDFGYDPLSLFLGETTSVTFEIFRKEDREPVEFRNVWVRVTKDEETVFAGSLTKAFFGNTRLTLRLPETGEYQISARFEGEKEEEREGEEVFSSVETLAEASFPLTILKGESQSFSLTPEMIIGFIAGLVLGLLPLPVLLKQRR